MLNFKSISTPDYQLYLCEHPQKQLSSSELKEALEQLPAFRKEKALKYRFNKDKTLCTIGYLLLKKGLQEIYGITEDIEWQYGKNEKPRLLLPTKHNTLPPIHFNISHCDTAVACVISTKEIGIDVESIINFEEDLVRRVANNQEYESISQANSPNIELTRLWTIKESLLKRTGIGLVDNLHDVLKDIKAYTFITAIEKDYVLTICY